nr:photosystem II protein M [Cyperus simaoensis]ULQ64902.1 photosystem II protein M [Cyperus simaoensis]
MQTILLNFIYLKEFNISFLWDYIPSYCEKKKKKKNEIMEVNILAFIATALFILVPTSFLLIIYVKTVSQKD